MKSLDDLWLAGRQMALVLWRTFWKTTCLATAIGVVLFFAMHPNDLARPMLQACTGVAVISAYSLFFAIWIGLAAGLLRLMWQFVGALSLLPPITALVGGLAASTAAAVAFRDAAIGGGVHGGGQIAAVAVLGAYSAVFAVGAFAGLFLGAAMVVLMTAFSKKARSGERRR